MRAWLAVLLLAFLPACSAAGPRNGHLVVPIQFGQHVLSAEVVVDGEDRAKGLMFRREMGKNDGMIFVFSEPEDLAFWMKNTPLPLSIAFLDAEKTILNIEQMTPFDIQNRTLSKGPALYAVEAHRGWFEERGITAGSRAEFELPGEKKKE